MKKLLLIAGAPSHPPRMHEHRAGMLLLQRCLRAVPDLRVDLHDDGWVTSDDTLHEADAIALFADGGQGHPFLVGDRMAGLRSRVAAGMGLGCMHFAVDIPVERGATELQAWIGGYYQAGVSCNPIWLARFDRLPEHPITRGVRPFETNDEWYFDIQFADGYGDHLPTSTAAGTFWPILSATPSNEVRAGPYVYPKGPYPHILEQAGRREVLMWALERSDGGRAFGLTGGHFHDNWANADFRKVVLNALVWISGATVPPDGVGSALAPHELDQDLDPAVPA